MMRVLPAKGNEYWTPNRSVDISVMKTDIREKEGYYYLDIDLPGYKKEDIKITLFNGDLTVSAEKCVSNEEAGKVIRVERFTGSCSRSWYIGRSVSDADISAKFENGILTVSFPCEITKKESEKKLIDIN